MAAEEQLREAWEIRKKVFGEQHTEVAFSIRNLALNKVLQKKVDEGITLLGASLEMQRKLLGKDDPALIPGLRIMADLLHNSEDYSKAESYCRELMQIFRKMTEFFPEDLETALILLAENCYRQENYSEAADLYRECKASRAKRLPAQEVTLLLTQASLARALSDWAWSDRPGSAKLDAEIPKDITAAGLPGFTLGYQRAVEAEKLLREFMVHWDPTHWRYHDAKSRLGGALVALAVTAPEHSGTASIEKYLEAEKLLTEAYSIISVDSVVEAKYKKDTLIRLVRLYEAWGKADKTAEWKDKLAAFGKSKDGVSPDTHPQKTDL